MSIDTLVTSRALLGRRGPRRAKLYHFLRGPLLHLHGRVWTVHRVIEIVVAIVITVVVPSMGMRMRDMVHSRWLCRHRWIGRAERNRGRVHGTLCAHCMGVVLVGMLVLLMLLGLLHMLVRLWVVVRMRVL